jgi:hypothetical protein
METKVCEVEIGREKYEALLEAFKTPATEWPNHDYLSQYDEGDIVWDVTATFDDGFDLDLFVRAPCDFEDEDPDEVAWGELVLWSPGMNGGEMIELDSDQIDDFKEQAYLFQYGDVVYQMTLRVVNDLPEED